MHAYALRWDIAFGSLAVNGLSLGYLAGRALRRQPKILGGLTLALFLVAAACFTLPKPELSFSFGRQLLIACGVICDTACVMLFLQWQRAKTP